MLTSLLKRRVCAGLLAGVLSGPFAGHLHAHSVTPPDDQSCKCGRGGGSRAADESAGRDVSGNEGLNVRHQGSVEFVSGGIGDDEIKEMKKMARGYPLQFTFAERQHDHVAYVTDVRVTIRDQRNREVLDTVSEGSMLLVRLPSGRYQIEGSYRGRVRKMTVHLASGERRQLVIEWPETKD